MLRLILLSAAAIPVAVALSVQNREAAAPAEALAQAALAQGETPASLWWADYDADGLDDALAITPAGEPELLANLGDGEFRNVTRAAGLAGVSAARFAAWADIDGDGAQDLYIGTGSGPQLFVNQRNGTFVEAAGRSGLVHTSADLDAHFLDYDRNGELDLHVQTATGDMLYRGVGAGQFQRVALDLPTAVAGTAVIAHVHDGETAPPAPGASEADPANRTRPTGAGAVPTRSGAAPTNPLATRQPAPPGGYASVPCAFVNASASSVFDQTTSQCLLASSQGTLGNLYPLSNDFNVNAAGNVGIGINNAADRLHVNNGDIRISGVAGRELVLYDGAGQIAVRLDADASGANNNIQLRKGGQVAHQYAASGVGMVERMFHPPSGNAVLTSGVASDESGFLNVQDRGGAINISLDGDSDGSPTNGRSSGAISVRSNGTGGPGGVINVQNNDGANRAVLTGGISGSAATLEMFDTADRRTLFVKGDGGTGGNIFMFNDASVETVDIDSDSSGAGVIEVGNGKSSVATVSIDGNGPADDGGAITLFAADGSNTVFLQGEATNGGGGIYLQNDLSADTVRIEGDDGYDSGRIALLRRTGGSNVTTVILNAEEANQQGGSLQLRNLNGFYSARLETDGLSFDTLFVLYDADGSTSYSFSQFRQNIYNSAGIATISHNGNTGAKSAVQSTASYGQRLLYCMESPEVWFEDFGQARLTNGSVRVELDPMFLETVTIDRAHPMNVFVTPQGACNGMWVEPGLDHFVVHELANGVSNVPFNWRLVAKRKGLEDFRLEAFEEDARVSGGRGEASPLRSSQESSTPEE